LNYEFHKEGRPGQGALLSCTPCMIDSLEV
jgi:hypothetical protein